MVGRHTLAVTALAASVGVPYLSSHSPQLAHQASGWLSGEAATGAAAPAATPHLSSVHQAAPRPGQLPAEGAPVDLAEIFRFDIDTAWILARWPRITTGLAAIDSQGYRVSLVSGTRPDDLAGALTYYCDRQHRCERITFRGATGDPRRLVALLTSRFDLRQAIPPEPGMQYFVARWNGQPHSELRIRPSRVVRADMIYGRFEVDLVLRRT